MAASKVWNRILLVMKLLASGTWMYRNGAPWVSQKPKGKHNEPWMVKLRRGSGSKEQLKVVGLENEQRGTTAPRLLRKEEKGSQ